MATPNGEIPASDVPKDMPPLPWVGSTPSRAKAIKWFQAHPDDTLEVAAQKLGLSYSTVHIAHREMQSGKRWVPKYRDRRKKEASRTGPKPGAVGEVGERIFQWMRTHRDEAITSHMREIAKKLGVSVSMVSLARYRLRNGKPYAPPNRGGLPALPKPSDLPRELSTMRVRKRVTSESESQSDPLLALIAEMQARGLEELHFRGGELEIVLRRRLQVRT